MSPKAIHQLNLHSQTVCCELIRCLTIVIGFFLGATSNANESKILFDQQVRPILAKHCFACHGGVKQSGGLNLILKDSLLGESDSGPALLPGNPDDSEIVLRIIDEDPYIRMPPPEHGEALNPEEISIISKWIEQGAEWELPWAFKPILEKEKPSLESTWPRSAVDHYILAAQQANGHEPNEEASPEEWLRRVSFDLTGLPPSRQLIERLKKNPTNDNYATIVDELLTSPKFGERWASVWLDLARYADTCGYERDRHRIVWPYRDWLIRAFNKDMPYDEFLIHQLAGDQLSNSTIDSQLATAFHRNTQTNHEGGTDDEEFRIAAVIDRVDTTWQAVQGLTMACAKCHDHPYDPITQEDYYQFAGYFNSTQDCDLSEDWPKLKVPRSQKDNEQAKELDDQINSIDQNLHQQVLAFRNQDGITWQGLSILDANSTGDTKLGIQEYNDSINGSAANGDEVIASGTVSDRSFYTVVAKPVPGELRAIRIDALPKSIEEALQNPEYGFVLSRIQAFLIRADGSEQEIFFADVLSDEASPFFPANETLVDSSGGWSAYSRIFRPRWAVFVVDQQMSGDFKVTEEDKIRFTFKHDKTLDGQGALVMRRFRLAVSDNPSWTEFASDSLRQEALVRRHELVKKREGIKSVDVPIMAERPAEHRRPNYLFERGNFLVKGTELEPSIPAIFKTGNQDAKSRLAMSQWVVSRDNPLTARVWVNRIWHQLFGNGLSSTLDDFGTTGERPTHPELLDDLAHRLTAEHEWRLKPLLKDLVLSSTYRQSSKTNEHLFKNDPNNRWLARGPRTRLPAEMVRDQALVLSGYFNDQLYGPPVMPYQPKGVWRSVYNDGDWKTAENEDRFRRAIYTYWKRTSPYPSLVTFDQPSREVCAAKRDQTNTPLQAFVTMNDPTYIELAEGFAKRIKASHPNELEAQFAWGYQEATNQSASEEVLKSLQELYNKIKIQSDDHNLAMRTVALALMNLDATLTH